MSFMHILLAFLLHLASIHQMSIYSKRNLHMCDKITQYYYYYFIKNITSKIFTQNRWIYGIQRKTCTFDKSLTRMQQQRRLWGSREERICGPCYRQSCPKCRHQLPFLKVQVGICWKNNNYRYYSSITV